MRISDINASMEKIKTFWKIRENLVETVERNTDSVGSGDVMHHLAGIASRRIQLKNTGWRSNNTASKLINKAISSSTNISTSFVTKPALRVYSRKEKPDEIPEFRRRTVRRQLMVPEDLEYELEPTDQSSATDLLHVTINLPNMPTQIL